MKDQTKKLILLIVICFVTLMVLFIALKLNANRNYNLLSTSSIDKYLTEVRYDSISTHIIENSNAIIYVSNSSEESSKLFEKNFKKVIKKYNLENDIVYININDTNIVDPLYQIAPQLIFYKNGAVEDIIDCITLKTYDNIVKELEERSVIND